MGHTNRFSRVLISFLAESEPYLHGIISFRANLMSLYAVYWRKFSKMSRNFNYSTNAVQNN